MIKLLKNPYPSFNELVQFRNQYTIAKNLNSSLIIQTYSLEVYQNGYALMMEDFGGISLKDYLTRDQTRDIRFLQEFIVVIDGTCFDVPDSDENARVFGRPSSRPGTRAAFPKVRLVILVEAGLAHSTTR